MNVSDAIAQRRSCRAFLPDPVPAEMLREILIKAARAASGGNVQPWRVYLMTGDSLDLFRAKVSDRVARGQVDTPEYPVYPPKLAEPYRTSRFKVGETMYARLGIPRDDKPARLAWFANNYRLFGAPAAAFLYVDRAMGAAQWTDLGGYLAHVMLLAEEAGLATCAQEAWAMQHSVVSDHVGAPETWMLFCGIALGKPDLDAPVNSFMTEREPPEVWLKEV